MPRWLIIVVVLLAVYTLFGFLVVPWLIRRQVTAGSRKYLHREATLAAARFNPFTLETRFIGLDLRDRDGTPLFAFDTMVVNFSSASITHRATSLDEFRIVRPVAVARIAANGNLAIADLLEADTAGAPAPDTAAARPPRLEIRQVALVDGQVSYIDESRQPRYQEDFSDLSLTVEGLSTLPNEQGDHVLTVSFASGAQVRWTGRNSFTPLELTGEFELSRLRLSKLSEVAGRDLPLQLTDGRLSSRFRYAVTQAAGRGGLVVKIPEASASATEIAVRPRDASEDWARVPGIEVTGITVEWPARVAHVAQVRVTDPWLRAAREQDGQVDWQRVMAAMPADTAPPDTAAAWAVAIDSILVAGGSAIITDRVPTKPVDYALSGVTVALAPVTTDSTRPVGFSAGATIGKRASITARGQATPSPRSVDAELSLKGLELTLARPYLGANPPATIKSGTTSLQGKAKLRTTHPTATFDGSAAITGFAMADSVGDSLLAWKSMKVAGIHYTADPDLLRVKQVTLDQPFARIAISKDKTIHLMSLADMVPATDTARQLPYEIQEVAIVNARIDFSDESLILPFRTNIDSANGTIKDIATFGGAPGSLQLEGKIEDYGLARATGTLRVNDPYAATDIKAAFLNVSMPKLTPYSAQFAGYEITSGRLDVEMEYIVKDRQLQASHHIVATNLKLGNKVEGGDSPGFLVKLAISLMKDKDGRIKFDVPVEGTVDDPQFSYKGIVWQAVKQILGKVATAPFRFLGKLFGGGSGDDQELVDFDPGRTDIIPPERQKLDSLAAELGRKPDLTIAIEGRYDTIADAKAIRELKLQQRLAVQRDSAGKKAQADTSTSMLAQLMKAEYVTQFGKPAFDSLEASYRQAWSADTGKKGKFDPGALQAELKVRLLAMQVVDTEELVQLARDRSAAIATAITATGTVDSTRVSATDPQPVSKKKKDGSERIASELTMDAR